MNQFLLRIRTYASQNWQPLALAFVFVWLYVANLSPSTYLTGWDNLQTELYPWIGVKRAFFSVWQEYQSFGLLAGMAHGADLPRALLVYFMSFVLPQTLIRYSVHMMLLFLGAGGAYILFTYIFSSRKRMGKTLALVGAFGYLFHFATIQLFHVPFESFSYFYALLPWSMWAVLVLVQKKDPSIKYWFGLFMLFLLGTPAYYVQTFFIVHATILVLTSGILILRAPHKRLTFRRLSLVGVLILSANLYWLLPQGYFVSQQGAEVVKYSKINALSTEDVVFQNREFGTLGHVLKSESYYLRFADIQNGLMFAPWLGFRENLFVSVAIFGMIFVSLIGLWGKDKYHALFLGLFLLSLTALASDSLLFRIPHSFVRQIDLINQIFRSPFTKFGFVYALSMSYLLAQGALHLVEMSKKIHPKGMVIIGVIPFFILISSLPALGGTLFAKSMHVQIPKEYVEVFEYFKRVDANKRIALLPDYTFWGWFHHNWGYNGSGFLWYGIEQPIISRTFDTWSKTSEGYYWEIKAATDADDLDRFEEVLQKYDIDYLLLDQSLQPVTPTSEIILYDRIKALLDRSTLISLEKEWGPLQIYTVQQSSKSASFVSLHQNLPEIQPPTSFIPYDGAYAELGDYMSNSEPTFERYYPFRDLQSFTRDPQSKWSLEVQEDSIQLKTKLPRNLLTNNPALILPKYPESTDLLLNDEFVSFSNTFQIQNTEDELIISFPTQLVQQFALQNTSLTPCGDGQGSSRIKTYRGDVTIISTGRSTGCIGYETMESLPHYVSYVLSIQNTNQSGRRMLMYLVDGTRKSAFIEDRLQSDSELYILPARNNWGLQYSIHFHNNSYDREVSENTLSSLALYYFPTELFSKMYFVPKTNEYNSIDRKSPSLENAVKLHYGTYSTFIKDGVSSNDTILTLSQSFHPGWKAYKINSQFSMFNVQFHEAFPMLFGTELTDHVLVNNWANGFLLRPDAVGASEGQGSRTFIIIFWPQYLQFVGFGVLGLTIISFATLYLRDVLRRRKRLI